MKITQVPFALQSVLGSVKPKRKLENFKKLSREAREEHIDKAHMERQKSREVLSYDTDFDSVPDINRHEPS